MSNKRVGFNVDTHHAFMVLVVKRVGSCPAVALSAAQADIAAWNTALDDYGRSGTFDCSYMMAVTYDQLKHQNRLLC